MWEGRAGVGAAQTSAHPKWPIPKVLNSWLHRSITSSLLAVLSTLYFSFSIHFMRDIYKEMVYTGAQGEAVQDKWERAERNTGRRSLHSDRKPLTLDT